jgi:hypothetical protein
MMKLNFDLVGTYFDVAVGLVWSNDPESYAGGNVATGRATHDRQVKGDEPDKKGYPVPPGWGLCVRLATPPHKKIKCYETYTRKPKPINGCGADDDDDYEIS